jgi:shikimate dehydrogenase
VAYALGTAGAHVTVAARRADAAQAAAALADGTIVAWDQRATALAGAAIVVNATPVGMGPEGADDGALPVPVDALTAEQVVVDLVYHPLETPMLRAARDRGAQVVDGLGMLVHQAALQVETWTGRPAPMTAMRAAARDHLSSTQP